MNEPDFYAGAIASALRTALPLSGAMGSPPIPRALSGLRRRVLLPSMPEPLRFWTKPCGYLRLIEGRFSRTIFAAWITDARHAFVPSRAVLSSLALPQPSTVSSKTCRKRVPRWRSKAPSASPMSSPFSSSPSRPGEIAGWLGGLQSGLEYNLYEAAQWAASPFQKCYRVVDL